MVSAGSAQASSSVVGRVAVGRLSRSRYWLLVTPIMLGGLALWLGVTFYQTGEFLGDVTMGSKRLLLGLDIAIALLLSLIVYLRVNDFDGRSKLIAGTFLILQLAMIATGEWMDTAANANGDVSMAILAGAVAILAVFFAFLLVIGSKRGTPGLNQHGAPSLQ